MISRLAWMTLKPEVIAVTGYGREENTSRLQSSYPHARIFKPENLAALDALSVDMIFANLLLPWCDDYPGLFQEWRRILRPDGLLLLSAFGPDTLQEWRDAFSQADMPRLIDMHDLGDLMLASGFVDPVLEVSHYTLSYREKAQMFDELRGAGMWFPADSVNMDKIMAGIDMTGGARLEVTCEVVFAHAFGPAQKDEVSASEDGLVRVPVSQLRQRLRGK